jgi:hypothetical protein
VIKQISSDAVSGSMAIVKVSGELIVAPANKAAASATTAVVLPAPADSVEVSVVSVEVDLYILAISFPYTV